MILGDLGAEVIKVENPNGGDETRTWGPPNVGGEATYYLSINRNKRSIALDLSDPAARATLRRLADRSDVLLENFRPGTMERWGLGYEQLRASNPALVYCAISGYGPVGPLANTPGYDFILQASAGLMSISGAAEGAPTKLGVAIVDLLTGLNAAIGILAALTGREHDPQHQGRRVGISLFEAALAALINVGQSYLGTGRDAHRFGNAHPNIVPYQLFAAADGWLAVAVGNDRQFAAFSAALDHPEWATNPRFKTNSGRVTNRDELIDLISTAMIEHPAAYWREKLEAVGVPVGPLQTVAEVLESEQATALGIVRETEHPTIGRLRMVGSPLRLDGEAPTIRRPPPLLGQHTAEILAELERADHQ